MMTSAVRTLQSAAAWRCCRPRMYTPEHSVRRSWADHSPVSIRVHRNRVGTAQCLALHRTSSTLWDQQKPRAAIPQQWQHCRLH